MSKTFDHWTDPMGRITEEGRARICGIGATNLKHAVKPAAKLMVGEVGDFFDERKEPAQCGSTGMRASSADTGKSVALDD